MSDPTENGASDGDETTLAQRAAAAAEEAMNTDDLDVLFPDGYFEGDPWLLTQIHKERLPVEVTVSLSRAEVPVRAGIPDPRKAGRVIVSHEVAKYEPVPIREEGMIVGWKIRAHLRAIHVEPMGEVPEAIEREFERLMMTDRQAAALLADRLVRLASGGVAA